MAVDDAPGDEGNRLTWSKRNWESWKAQLAALASVDGFPAEARELALSLRAKMEAQG